MRSLVGLIVLFDAFLFTTAPVSAAQWPYHRHHGEPHKKSSPFQPVATAPEFTAQPTDEFTKWFKGIVQKDHTNQFRNVFKGGWIPDDVTSVDELLEHLNLPFEEDSDPPPSAPPLLTRREEQSQVAHWPHFEADDVFSYLKFPLDPRCTIDKTRWWYRTYDGSCNWIKSNEISQGQTGTGKSRDYNQHYYADGISKPREGPNPRAVSNAFFKRHKALYYEHTPFLLGYVEFLIHDVTWSQDSTTEFIDVPMPPDETGFSLNTTLRVWRTAAVPGTGTSPQNPRENVNMATTWMDLSSLYGSTEDVGRRLRSFHGGKLLVQNWRARGAARKAPYLPFNTMSVPTRTRPGVDPAQLFAGGDPRTNEDWIMLAVHTVFLREHNRLCDVLAARHSEFAFDDERLYQTVRLLMSAKMQLIGNAYQMAYWSDAMPWPRDDGFPLFRAIHGKNVLDINPANTYPWPLVTRAGKPMTISAEMAVVYRFHEFIIPSFPIVDKANTTLWQQNLFDTGFDAKGFLDAGLENILRGVLSTTIPNFKSGVDESFRTAGKYRGEPFDVATWSIVHEREQGLPTFNNYFRAYAAEDPHVPVPIRNTFENFSSDPATVANLRRLYATPDDVDLVVGVQLDEEYFPGTTIPKSAAIISLISLFGTGNSDRFSVGFAMMRCWLVDKPWDCRPSNALEALIWRPLLALPADLTAAATAAFAATSATHTNNTSSTAAAIMTGANGTTKADLDSLLRRFPRFRFYDSFWLRELDIQAHGTNLLWRMVVENTEIDCLQRDPLFPVDPKTNPVLCGSLPPSDGSPASRIVEFALTAVEVGLAILRQHFGKVLGSGAAALASRWVYARWAASIAHMTRTEGNEEYGDFMDKGTTLNAIYSEDEEEFTGNASVPSSFRYHDTVAVLIPKHEIHRYMRNDPWPISSYIEEAENLLHMIKDFEDNKDRLGTKASTLQIMADLLRASAGPAKSTISCAIVLLRDGLWRPTTRTYINRIILGIKFDTRNSFGMEDVEFFTDRFADALASRGSRKLIYEVLKSTFARQAQYNADVVKFIFADILKKARSRLLLQSLDFIDRDDRTFSYRNRGTIAENITPCKWYWVLINYNLAVGATDQAVRLI
ncbi:hypothetical protein VTK73DRAFT_9104 [Phialemonium thermophilum]|uniref:Animal haem peroxidase n=1 Tax=Phialemonium thermophilum TaxID=223376 RepID=A0ABR3XMQ5_9PEZI